MQPHPSVPHRPDSPCNHVFLYRTDLIHRATQRLLDLLQVACAIIVALKYNGVVTNNLQSWGFLAQAKTPATPPENEPPVGG